MKHIFQHTHMDNLMSRPTNPTTNGYDIFVKKVTNLLKNLPYTNNR